MQAVIKQETHKSLTSTLATRLIFSCLSCHKTVKDVTMAKADKQLFIQLWFLYSS